MRKEQHKASLQKKQYLNLDKPESECVSDSDMSALADDVKEKSRLLDRRKELDVSTTLPDTDNDSGKSSFPSQTSASRPLVPPGFRSTLLEKDSGLKAVIQLPLKQVRCSMLFALVIYQDTFVFFIHIKGCNDKET